MHQVHIEAYFKITLLFLIVKGETFDMKQGGVSSVLVRELQMREARVLETLQAPSAGINMGGDKWHSDLTTAWETADLENVDQVIAANMEQLQHEKQLGLAQRLRASLIQKKIADLSATYLTLSFSEIAEKTGINKEGLEDEIAKMIS